MMIMPEQGHDGSQEGSPSGRASTKRVTQQVDQFKRFMALIDMHKKTQDQQRETIKKISGRIAALEQQNRQMNPFGVPSTEDLHKGMPRSYSTENVMLPDIEQSEQVHTNQGIFSPRLSNQLKIASKDPNKFTATNDFSIYDPLLKNKVRYRNEKGSGGRPSQLTSEILNMMKGSSPLPSVGKKRGNSNLLTAVPPAGVNPKSKVPRGGSVQINKGKHR